MAIKYQLTHDLIWYVVGIFLIAIFHRGCPIHSAIFYRGFPTRFSISTKRECGNFFFFWQHAFMCKHLYHYNFLVVSLSFKKKKRIVSLTIFFFFLLLNYFFYFLEYKIILYLNFLYLILKLKLHVNRYS